MSLIYIVLGERECVYQERIGGEFTPHPEKEVVRAFRTEAAAEEFVRKSKLQKPKKERFGDTSHYRGGYCGLEVMSVTLED